MRLLHYTREPFAFDPTRVYESKHWKPAGLWVSVEGEHDWPAWCRGEGWNTESLKHMTEIVLRPDAKVLRIASAGGLRAFDQRHGNGDPLDCRSIDWKPIQGRFDGIIIAPYQWSVRLDLMWYYGWDCASGVIWNLGAVQETRPLETECHR